ncbi:hypothetical protein ABE28_011195 [Peribacillus muralis]|uniref:SIR2-like domain-containing protein n=1 Tax=Peribacillus muralis TaxID=264697 RepID=A0A1B3XNW3_9BACI|nr:hypothetical protein [Peribacillus muralis]AOH54918.1 hypothetical protein ABE28_011195 [Peribacillus muralis]
MSNEINILQFNEYIDKNKSVFLCGNGFSMNFDTDFGRIYDKLLSSHKNVIYNSSYGVKANKNFTRKCMENFQSVKKFLRNISEDYLYGIFNDALIFAESIIENKKLIEVLWEEKLITKLGFGLSQIDILYQICEVGKNKGITYVNIEHWTILIYFYFAIKKLNLNYYEFPSNNSFITVLKVGNKSPIKLLPQEQQIYEEVTFNGFTTYYRFLFSIAIFSNGKALDMSMLSNINNLDMESIKNFLNKFDLLLSLNYDKIMENIVGDRVEHFHGEFVKNKTEYVSSQSLGLNYENGYVSFSDILIGDFFIFKAFLPVVNNFSKNPYNKKVPHFSDIMDTLIKDNSINNIVIFGMNIENDQHVLRNIMLAFYFSQQINPQIIYCYFTPEEKRDFEEQFEAVITFSPEVNKYVKNINVSYIKTQEVLKEYFQK